MAPSSPWPSRRSLILITVLVVLVHIGLLLGGPDALQLSLRAEPVKTLPFQTRQIEAVAPSTPTPPKAARKAPAQRTQTAPHPDFPPADTPLPLSDSSPSEAIPAPPPTPAPPEPAAIADSAPTEPVPPAQPLQTASPPWVPLSVGALPPSTLISYKLNGQERGFNYYANGELRWQHNPTDYEAALTVKAFLLGSRVFSSAGRVGTQGLMPTRFADKWRGERATHFDAEQQRIVFSNNKPPAELQAGAQDQVSLFVQLAAAMTGDPDRYKPGTSVSIQTATVNEAVPWTLTMEAEEVVSVDDKNIPTSKWVCLPRGKYDTKVELWLSKAHAWLPVRIRITQVSGNFIDMRMDNLQPLAPLPAKATDKP